MLSFIQNRPPLVVIFLCILTAALTLTYFAFYVNSSNFIADNDVIYDWNQLLKHFNELESCVENETKIETAKNEETDVKSVNTIISISPYELSKYSSVVGNLIIKEWKPVCDRSNPPPNEFQIAFNVINSNLTNIEVCASIKGPKRFLPTFFKPICNVTHITGKKDIGNLSTVKRKNKMFCKNGFLTKITFFPGDTDNFANYLNNDRKDIIYLHLLWSVYILFGVLIIISIYEFLDSNQHMKYIEKCSNLIQRK